MRNVIGCVLVAVGVVILFTAVVGMFRFKYTLNRMHSAAMADTLGIGFIMLGCIVLYGFSAATGKMILLLVFLWLTAPISSHLLARMDILTQEKPGKYWKEEKR
ncbi:MAG: monovalent cation/H(+) antiporter subunit G [Oscillospiraceae bacterium]|nr:monovalent cation/H(+) antiporter subunit G [Oscillospiraceae bacterium]